MYFDNVGGIHFEAAMMALAPHGRVAVCGGISKYNNGERSAERFFPTDMIYTFQRVEVCLRFNPVHLPARMCVCTLYTVHSPASLRTHVYCISPPVCVEWLLSVLTVRYALAGIHVRTVAHGKEGQLSPGDGQVCTPSCPNA